MQPMESAVIAKLVMAGLVPAIRLSCGNFVKAWMPGTSPDMTKKLEHRR
jgi:hypothetical protein